MSTQSHAFQPADRQKSNGTWLLAASLVLAVLAQTTLIQAYKQTGFWEVGNCLTDFVKNSSPLPGLLLYTISGWIFILNAVRRRYQPAGML